MSEHQVIEAPAPRSAPPRDIRMPADGGITRRVLLVEAAWYCATGLLALLATAVVLELWDASLHVPFGFVTGDSANTLMVAKMIVSHNAVFSNPDVGAPYGLELYDYPFFADLGSIVGIWTLGLFSSDPVAVVNAFFVLGFAACAANAYLVLRILRLPRGVAVLCGVLFGLLPYHFIRGQAHLVIGAYWAVPFAGLLLLGALGHVRLFSRRTDAGSRFTEWLTPRTGLTVLACLAVGTTLHYYALFTLMLMVGAAVVRVLAARSLRVAAAPLAVCAIVGAGTLAMIAPTLVYRLQHGTNELVAHREPQEAERFGLKLTHLVLPLENHRVPALRKPTEEYESRTAMTAESQSAPLGLTMTIGLLAAVGALLAAALAGRAPPRDGRLLRDSGLLSLLAFLLGTVGGGSALVSFLLTSQLRGWARISVFIAFFAVVAVGVLLARAQRRLAPWQHGRVAFAAGLAALGVLGVLDQTARGFRPDYAHAKEAWTSDARFVRAIEERLPDGAMVLQLPYEAYPEGGKVNRMEVFDHLVGYVHSDRLRWSYAAMRGRQPDDWGAALNGRPMREVVPAAAAAGFRGVWVDTFGYPDGGAQILGEIGAVAGGGPALRSQNGRLAFFDLAPVARELQGRARPPLRQAAADALVRPITPSWGAGFYQQEGDGTNTWRWAHQRATLTLENRARRTRRVRASLVLSTPRAPQPVTIRLPDGEAATVTTAPDGTQWRRTLDVPPGTSTLSFATAAPDDGVDPRDPHLQVVNATFADTAFGDLAARLAPGR